MGGVIMTLHADAWSWQTNVFYMRGRLRILSEDVATLHRARNCFRSKRSGLYFLRRLMRLCGSVLALTSFPPHVSGEDNEGRRSCGQTFCDVPNRFWGANPND